MHVFTATFLYSNADRSWLRWPFLFSFFFFFFFFFKPETRQYFNEHRRKAKPVCVYTGARKHGRTPRGVVRNSVAEGKKNTRHVSPLCYLPAFPRKKYPFGQLFRTQNPFPRGRILSLIDRNYYSQKVSFRYRIAHRAGSGKKSPSRNSKKPSAARQSPSSSTFQSTSPFSTQRQPNSSRVTGSEIPDPGKTRPISASTRFASRIVSRNPPPPGSVREFASMMTVARKSEREQR